MCKLRARGAESAARTVGNVAHDMAMELGGEEHGHVGAVESIRTLRVVAHTTLHATLHIVKNFL